MKRILAAAAVAVALVLPVASVSAASHAPVAGGFGDWPLKK